MSVAEVLSPPAAGAADEACAHCGLPVPAALRAPAGGRAFCCAGCRTAWDILHDLGMAHYYALAQRRGEGVRPSGRSFEEFDHSAFHDLYVRRRGDGLLETRLYLEGVHCASCVWLIERVPIAVPGAAEAELDVPRSIVRLAWDGTRVPLSALARFLDTLGYRARPFRGARADELRRAEDRAALARVGIAGAIAANVMLLALALYAGRASGMEHGTERYFRWASLIVALPALLGPGRVFLRGAGGALRARALHMDLPIALALVAGYARGAVNTVTDRGPIYFDGVTALIFLLLVGRLLQQRAQRSAAESAELLHALAPATARLVEGDEVREVPSEALLPGALFEVRAGETIAADGRVVEGCSAVNLALLSGESRPRAVEPGAEVFAGTVNVGALMRVRAAATGEASRLGHLVREVAAAAARRAPVVQLADRLAGGFVAVVLALALVTALLWLRWDPARALDHAVALLIVTCPCALALATPLAVTAAIGRAARAGILIKGGEALERLGRPGVLVLDKTGTLTEGHTALTGWRGPEDVRPLVLALERHSPHPIAEGFRRAWPDVRAAVAERVIPTLGGGLEGEVAGRRVVVGSPAYVRARAADPAAAAGATPDPAATPVWVAVDGRVVARAAFGDRVRDEAPATLAALRARGWRLRLLSGDEPGVVAAVGASLGFAPEECRGAASPEEKLAEIEALARSGPVVMVGDGVNDAAAIARASVGVGVRGGAEACLAAADVFLARPGLGGLEALVGGAARTLGLIRRNLAFSLVYNLAGAALAVCGLIHPLLAAVLMPASSITVVLASRFGRTFDRADP